MVTLPNAPWRRRDDLVALIEALGGPDSTRVVGGAVRDSLLGLPVSDIDLATRLAPGDVIRRVTAAGLKAVPTGIAHGTITVVTPAGPVEVTTLRRDVATDGRHATVAFSDDWSEDAARRDFTINALYADLATGEIFDWFGGLVDLDAQRVCFIGDPLTRIAEDHLRILRFFRFHARFGVGDPDADALAACTARANDLMALSRERIAAELLKLLAAPDPTSVVAILMERRILRAVLPELDDAAPLARCVAREAALGVGGDAVRRLAALIGHRGDLSIAIARRLKLSKAMTRRLTHASRSRPGMPAALAYRIGPEAAVDALVLGEGNPADIALLADWERPRLPISGGALIARGLEPGPAVAETLARIEARWVDQQFPTRAAFDALVAEELSRAP